MKQVLVFFGVCLLVACGQKKKERVINLKDVIPVAADSECALKDTAKTETNLGFNSLIANELKMNAQYINTIDLSLLPDRFNPKSVTKLNLFVGQDSIVFSQWIFRDSSHTQNAFYNWLDCFGKGCKSFKIGQKSRFQNESFIMFVNDTSLTYLSSQINLNPKQWIQYFEKNNAIETWKYLVHQPVRSKASWFNVLNGTLTPLVLNKKETNL